MISRFNPTTNGPLHIGHIYNVLVAQAESDSFVLRFDDNQSYWIIKLGKEAMLQHAASQLRDLMWMGLVPDSVVYNSNMENAVLSEMAGSPHWRQVVDGWPCNPESTPIIISKPRIEPWGSMFHLTAEKVILDHLTGIDVMVRGLELLQENALYLYLCGIFGYPIPRKMIYIPRLMAGDGREMTDISKTRGDWKICDLRERGVKPEEILFILCQSCLIDPTGSWQHTNLKGNPILKEIEL